LPAVANLVTAIREHLLRPFSVIKGMEFLPLVSLRITAVLFPFLGKSKALQMAIMFNGAWRDDIENGDGAGEIPEGALTIDPR
jgi:hypothetical protein